MKIEEHHLFTIVEDPKGARHPVLHWPGYGIVAPTLVMTNGNWHWIVSSISGRDRWTLEPALLAPTNVGEVSMVLAVYCDVYLKRTVESWPPTQEALAATMLTLFEGPERERYLRLNQPAS